MCPSNVIGKYKSFLLLTPSPHPISHLIVMQLERYMSVQIKKYLTDILSAH
jgi:hypothetical protein